MDMAFPEFVRASEDTTPPQPPQKSLLQLVVEAGGNLGVVPQRDAPRRKRVHSSRDPALDGDHQRSRETSQESTRELVTRTSWIPPSYLLDHFFQRQAVEGFAELYGLTSNRLRGLPPPLLCIRDMRLPPVIERSLCQRLAQRRGPRAGHGGHERRFQNEPASECVEERLRAGKLEQLKQLVFGEETVAEAAADVSIPASGAADIAEEMTGQPPLRGIQLMALPSLLLGNHALLSGPRGCGKSTAGCLALACNTLARVQMEEEQADEESGDDGAVQNKESATAMHEAAQLPRAPLRPRAMMLFSSFSELLESVRWMCDVFGTDAFDFTTFTKGSSGLQSLELPWRNNQKQEHNPPPTVEETPRRTDLADLAITPESLLRLINGVGPCDPAASVTTERSVMGKEVNVSRRHRSSSSTRFRRRHRGYSTRSHHRHASRDGRHRGHVHGDRDGHHRHGSRRRRHASEHRRHGESSRHHCRRRRRMSRSKERRSRHHREESPSDRHSEVPPPLTSLPTHSEALPSTVRELPMGTRVPPPLQTLLDAHAVASADPTQWLPDFIKRRVPIIATTFHSLQEALQDVDGNASLLPLESVRTLLLVSAHRLLMPPLRDAFANALWVSLGNAMDVDCQYILTVDRMVSEMQSFAETTMLPDAGDRLVAIRQADESIWCFISVQPHVVEVPAEPGASHSGGRPPRVSMEAIESAKVQDVSQLVCTHLQTHSLPCKLEETASSAIGNSAGADGGGGSVVICTSGRREQTSVASQLEQAILTLNTPIRVTTTIEEFSDMKAGVLIVCDTQLQDARALRALSTGPSVGLLVHFSFPHWAMTGTREDMEDCLTARARAVLGPTWRLVQRRTASSSLVDVRVLMTEHHMTRKVGALLLETIQVHCDALAAQTG